MTKSMRYLILILSSFFLLLSSAGNIVAGDYAHKVTIADMSFEWTVDGGEIHIQLTAKTKGWLGIGFSPESRMRGANFILGYVKQGEVSIQDAYGIREIQHIKDEANDGETNISDVSGFENGNRTTISFTIPMDSGDSNDKPMVPGQKTTVLLGFGPDRDNFYSRHTFRTRIQVNLQTGEYETQFLK